MSQVIDVWMQHPTKDFQNHEMFASLRRWNNMELVKEDLPVAHTLAAMDQANVGLGILSAWYGHNGPLLSNEHVADIIQKNPDRFRGLASVDIMNPVAGLKDLAQWTADKGFVGVRQLPWIWGLPPTDRHFYPLWARCSELGLPVCLQVGHTGPMRASEVGRPIPYIDEMALDFPDLTIVCGHIGYPWTQEMIAVATKYPNVYIDTSAYTAKRYPPELVQYMKTNGRKKVLFGSNFPMITPGKCLQGLEAFGLDDQTRDDFLFGNAQRVFGLSG